MDTLTVKMLHKPALEFEGVTIRQAQTADTRDYVNIKCFAPQDTHPVRTYLRALSGDDEITFTGRHAERVKDGRTYRDFIIDALPGSSSPVASSAAYTHCGPGDPDRGTDDDGNLFCRHCNAQVPHADDLCMNVF